MKNRILVSIIMVVLFSSILGFHVSGEISYLTDISTQPILSSTEPYFENVVYITWDGTNYKYLEKYIDNGTLVNTKKIDQLGYRQTIRITSHRTSTNPGMATLETGYGAEITLIPYNMFGEGTIKQAIPDGYCIAERLKVAFGSEVKTGHFFSWSYHQIDETYIAQSGNNTDPIFENITPGLESDYWFAAENLTWAPDDPESRDAALNTFNEDIQMYSAPLIRAEFLATKAAAWLENVTSERFYLRMHFTEPDQAGHGYGEYTSEYKQALISCDTGTGMIIDVLENAGILDKTLFIIGADYGMYDRSHDGAGWPQTVDEISTNTFIFSNSSIMIH
ncbi:MAG: sulfatase-like hydrolase/transferase [Candidatus Heimdallarchaeota archaeon]|nr:sulfatase-like hydrolase/transferase [Candidatus Heimdallarchaeota archaeon]